VAVGILADLLRELDEQAALLRIQAARDANVEMHAQIAAASARERGHALAAQDADVARLHAWWDLELDLPLGRGHGDGRADGGVHHGQPDHRDQVVAVADEAVVGPHAHLDEGIAGMATGDTGVPLPLDANPLAVVDPGGDLDVERPLLDEPPLSVAALAWRLDDHPGAAAARAAGCAHELTEHALRDLLDPAGPAACQVRDRRGSRLGAGPPAALAGDRDLQGNLHLRPAIGSGDGDLDGCSDVGAATTPSGSPGLPEEPFAEEGGEQVGD